MMDRRCTLMKWLLDWKLIFRQTSNVTLNPNCSSTLGSLNDSSRLLSDYVMSMMIRVGGMLSFVGETQMKTGAIEWLAAFGVEMEILHNLTAVSRRHCFPLVWKSTEEARLCQDTTHIFIYMYLLISHIDIILYVEWEREGEGKDDEKKREMIYK